MKKPVMLFLERILHSALLFFSDTESQAYFYPERPRHSEILNRQTSKLRDTNKSQILSSGKYILVTKQIGGELDG